MRTPQIPARFYFIVVFLFFAGGCASAPVKTSDESQQEAVSAMEKVLGTVSGEKIDEKRLRELDREMKNDPQAKSAVETIANSVSGQGQVIKYCPVDGERYGPKFEECPVHHVPLKTLSD